MGTLEPWRRPRRNRRGRSKRFAFNSGRKFQVAVRIRRRRNSRPRVQKRSNLCKLERRCATPNHDTSPKTASVPRAGAVSLVLATLARDYAGFVKDHW
jgi:hypothetical protein